MCHSARRSCETPYQVKNLVRQYHAQRIAPDSQPAMMRRCAVAFRPGGHAGSFEGRKILPAGVSTMFVLRYHSETNGDGRQIWRMPLAAYHASVHASGTVEYASYGQRLSLDLALKPRSGNRGKAIDPERNPSLLETALRMDKACQRVVNLNRFRAPEIIFPRVLLAFPVGRLPTFVDTPYLREIAAKEVQLPQEKLGGNGSVLLERLLRDIWERQFIQPGDAGNQTGTVLIDGRLCPGAPGFLRAYEDFTDLLGSWTWNPARDVRVECHPNPAYEVLRAVGLGDRPDFDQPLEGEFILDMVRRFKTLLGDDAQPFTDEDLLDGLTTPNHPLVRWSFELPRLRARLPIWAAEAAANEDMKRAVREPNEALFVRHACRVQVLDAAALPPGLHGFSRTVPSSRGDESDVIQSELPLAI